MLTAWTNGATERQERNPKPDELPPDPERIVFAADRAGFGMNTTPKLLETLLTEAAATVTSAADNALAESGGGGDPADSCSGCLGHVALFRI